jgi:hypothetical protein
MKIEIWVILVDLAMSDDRNLLEKVVQIGLVKEIDMITSEFIKLS